MFFPRFLSHGPLMDDDPAPGGGGDPAPQGGDPNPGSGDPPAAPALTLDALKDLLKTERQATLAEVTKQINGLDAKYQKQLKKQEPTQPLNPQLTAEQLFEQKQREYEERIANIEHEREQEKAQSQQRELDAEIKSALADFPWQTDSKGSSEGKEVAFTFYRSQAKRDDDGRLLIGDMPLAAYIKEHAARAFKAYHAPRNVGGAGAAASKGTIAPGLSADALRAKAQSGESLSAEEKTALRSELINLLPRRN